MTMTTQRRSERGFTLTELIISIFVFTIIMVAALALYDRNNRVFKTSVEASDMQQNTRSAYDRVVADLRMIGFDYDRDGVPSTNIAAVWKQSTAYPAGAIVTPPVANGFTYKANNNGTSNSFQPPWKTHVGDTFTDNTITWTTQSQTAFQQPDEQIEYAGFNSVVFRGNFNYQTAASTDHGREIAYEPVKGQFPVVTTSNSEIVAYALRSMDSTKNTGSISFYADVAKPRAAYPGGSAESLVTISGIDTTNDNPPYQLVRFTLQDDGSANGGPNVGQPDAGTVIADNIRSINFFYYTDANGTTLLTKTGTVLVNGAIGGAGQYDPANAGGTADFGDRDLRATIQRVRVDLVGMNSQPDKDYMSATETAPATQHYRTYSLSSLVLPRNMRLSGSAETTPDKPGSFKMTGVCYGSCRVPIVYWDPPTTGVVDHYEVHWDTAINGSYNSSKYAGLSTSLAITDPLEAGGTVPSKTYYFRVYALNDSGVTQSVNYIAIQPLNTTKPAAPSGLSATTNQPDTVNLSWAAPTTNDTSANKLKCVPLGSGSDDATTLASYEPITYRVARGAQATFDPATAGAMVLTSTTTPLPALSGGNATWSDTASVTPLPGGAPAPCVSYYYRVQALDSCAGTANYNDGGNANLGYSAWNPPVDGSANAVPGKLTSTVTPGNVTGLKVNTSSSCVVTPPPLGTCTVSLTWNKVTVDSTGKPMTVNAYLITRTRKSVTNPTPAAFPLAQPIQTGYAFTSGFLASFTDSTAEKTDASGTAWNYTYKVQALNECNSAAGIGSTVDYPVACATASITQVGAASGNGSLANPWVMNANDVIRVTSGSPISAVTFQVSSGGVVLDTVKDTVFPWEYYWKDQASYGAVFQVDVMTDFGTCLDTQTVYVKQVTLGGCITGTAAVSGTIPVAGNGATTNVTYTINNSNASPLTLNSLHFTWAQPAGYPPMTLKKITYSVGAATASDTPTVTAPGTVDQSVTPNAANVPSSSSTYQITFTYGWVTSATSPTTQPSSPLSGVCVTFLNGPQVFSCNIVGSTSGNPGTCN